MPVGDRERNRGLAIILFAKPPTISPRHAHGMLALLRKARVIDDDQGAYPRNGEATGAAPKLALAPQSPPGAQRSCARSRQAGPHSNRGAAPSGRDDQWLRMKVWRTLLVGLFRMNVSFVE